LTVIRPIFSPFCSVNQRLPSGPVVMLEGALEAVGSVNSVIAPAGVILPILFAVAANSVNQRLPSGPVVIPAGKLLVVGMNVSPKPAPAAAPRLFFSPLFSTTHSAPSGPAVMPSG